MCSYYLLIFKKYCANKNTYFYSHTMCINNSDIKHRCLGVCEFYYFSK